MYFGDEGIGGSGNVDLTSNELLLALGAVSGLCIFWLGHCPIQELIHQRLLDKLALRLVEVHVRPHPVIHLLPESFINYIKIFVSVNKISIPDERQMS